MGGVKADMVSFLKALEDQYRVPKIRRVVFPQPDGLRGGLDCRFMALQLEDGSTGLGYTGFLEADYKRLSTHMQTLPGCSPFDVAARFTNNTRPLDKLLGLSAINAISQHVMGERQLYLETTDDPFAGLSLTSQDRLGMVGFFGPLMGEVKRLGAELRILERAEVLPLVQEYPVTTDVRVLKDCNKICITATTLLNDSLDELLENCQAAEIVVVIGPTAGFLPDVLFTNGVDAVGGRRVHDGDSLIECIHDGRPWGSTTEKTLYRSVTYTSPVRWKK